MEICLERENDFSNNEIGNLIKNSANLIIYQLVHMHMSDPIKNMTNLIKINSMQVYVIYVDLQSLFLCI